MTERRSGQAKPAFRRNRHRGLFHSLRTGWDRHRRTNFRRENQSGETSPAELGQLGQQPQGQAGQGGLESGAIEGDSLTGTIEKIEGDTVTLNTPQGLLQVITAADTTIQMFSQGTAADLDAGVRVTVIGPTRGGWHGRSQIYLGYPRRCRGLIWPWLRLAGWARTPMARICWHNFGSGFNPARLPKRNWKDFVSKARDGLVREPREVSASSVSKAQAVRPLAEMDRVYPVDVG